MSQNPKTRNYKKEYADYQGTEEQKKNRAARNAARDKLADKGLVKKGDGKDVHHKRPLRSGGSNEADNLAVASVKKNRGWNKKK